MNFKVLLFVGALVGVLGSPVAVLASTINYTSILSGAGENPPNASPGTGLATYSLTGDLFTINISFSGLTAPASAAHIHCCAPVGTNAVVVLPFTPFPNATSGSYSNMIDLSTYSFGGGLTEASFLAGMNAGLAYTNIHDSKFPAGEIRGQISTVTPEPGSLLLVGTGVLGALAAVRRRLRS